MSGIVFVSCEIHLTTVTRLVTLSDANSWKTISFFIIAWKIHEFFFWFSKNQHSTFHLLDNFWQACAMLRNATHFEWQSSQRRWFRYKNLIRNQLWIVQYSLAASSKIDSFPNVAQCRNRKFDALPTGVMWRRHCCQTELWDFPKNPPSPLNRVMFDKAHAIGPMPKTKNGYICMEQSLLEIQPVGLITRLCRRFAVR